MSAQPDTDRSLNAAKPPVTEASPAASTNAAPDIAPIVSTGEGQTIRTDQNKSEPDLSSLTREQLEAKVKILQETVIAANTEAEYFHQQWRDLRLRDEALGVEALTVDERKLEDKLVQAMKEVYQSEMKRREALQLMGKLLDTTNALLQTAPNYDPKVRADYEVASRSARDYLAGHSGHSIPMGTSLNDVQIADVNAGLNAVVLNIGKSLGVKEGMPFLIFRDNLEIARVKVVLARELVSAALVESIKSGVALKMGDQARVDAQK